MCKTLKAVLFSVYFAVFLHSIIYLLLVEKQDILELNYVLKTPGSTKRLIREIRKHRRNSTIMTLDFQRPERLHTDLKFILKWNIDASYHHRSINTAQKAFILYNCPYYNCYLTHDKSLLVDLRYFDAILFGIDSDWDDHPPFRAEYQRYIFTSTYPASSNPICNQNYENYFNFTWTYKLDSDITASTMQIIDKNLDVVGPRINMTWVYPMKPTSEEVKKKLKGKRKAVAWIVSDCSSTSIIHQNFVKELEKSLGRYNFQLDTFGWCGKLKCPRQRLEECLLLLKKEYFFYFAFERSLNEDYVSQELLYPLQNYAVPVVYGGADYSRFLPPGSYIDATKLQIDEIVSQMAKAIQNPNIYYEYFRWHNHYTYKETSHDEGICSLCELLNDPARNNSVIQDIRQWWNPKYKKYCY